MQNADLETNLEILVDQEVTANQVEESQPTVQFGLDCKEALGHDLLHPLLMHKKEKRVCQFVAHQESE